MKYRCVSKKEFVQNLDDEDLGRRLLTVGNEKKTCRPPNDIQDGGKQEVNKFTLVTSGIMSNP